MSKKLTIILWVLTFCSCTNFDFIKEDTDGTDIVAIVNTSKLFKKDINAILPNNISKEDSIIFVKNYINNWATQQILLSNAENNISKEAIEDINTLVNNYRTSLLINDYKEKLVSERLDTLISDDEIRKYYNSNKENFKLNEEIIQIKYLQFDKKVISKNDFIRYFKKADVESLDELYKKQINFKSFQLNDTAWNSLNDILGKLPFEKDILLKNTKYLEKQDSLDLYLVSVNNILYKNDIAPLSYIKPKLKEIILQQRRIELIKKIEKILLNDAIKNNNFKVY